MSWLRRTALKSNSIVQVAQNLLGNALPGVRVEAARCAIGGWTWEWHLRDASLPGTPQYKLLGPLSTERWDYVIFQARLSR